MKGLNRSGFSILEEAVVIGIIALLAIPIATFLVQSFRIRAYNEKDLKGQYYANLIMQDFERRIRQATSGSIVITVGNPYKITFSYNEADKSGGNPAPVTYNYEIDNPDTPDSLFYCWKDGESKTVFPPGLEKGIIKDFEITDERIDTTQDPPYYITAEIETETGIVLQKTIYLVNYYK